MDCPNGWHSYFLMEQTEMINLTDTTDVSQCLMQCLCIQDRIAQMVEEKIGTRRPLYGDDK